MNDRRRTPITEASGRTAATLRATKEHLDCGEGRWPGRFSAHDYVALRVEQVGGRDVAGRGASHGSLCDQASISDQRRRMKNQRLVANAVLALLALFAVFSNLQNEACVASESSKSKTNNFNATAVGHLAADNVKGDETDRDLHGGVTRPRSEEKPALVGEENHLMTFQKCYKDRFHGYWDDATHSMRSFDLECDAQLQTLVQEPAMPNPTARNMMEGQHTSNRLFDQLEGSCVLLFGDSTDRQIVENWCPRWMENVRKNQRIELWMPDNVAASDRATKRTLKKGNGGLRCSPRNKFTFGSYMHYGVSPPPYWKFAYNMYEQTDDAPVSLNWGNTTEDRIAHDVPKFFEQCHATGHDKLKVIVIQSYLWDLARQWHVHGTARPPVTMIQEWAHNVTLFIDQVRTAVPDVFIAWRFAGPMEANQGRDAQAIYDMNQALSSVNVLERVDFVADYGAVLSSTLAMVNNKGPFNVHPPALPRTAYLNVLLNSLVLARQVFGPTQVPQDEVGLSFSSRL